MLNQHGFPLVKRTIQRVLGARKNMLRRYNLVVVSSLDKKHKKELERETRTKGLFWKWLQSATLFCGAVLYKVLLT